MNTSMRSVTKTYDVLDAFDYARYRNESSLRTTATRYIENELKAIPRFKILDWVTSKAKSREYRFLGIKKMEASKSVSSSFAY